MAEDWQKLGPDVYYRKTEIYQAQWASEPERLNLCIVAGAPYGGPVATVRNERILQPVRGNLKPELQIWTSAGRLLSSTVWNHQGLLAMGWSSQEKLVCVFTSGVVRNFSVMCEPQEVFSIHGVEQDGGAAMAAFWGGGVAIVTNQNNLYINLSLTRSADAGFKVPGFKERLQPNAKPPLCMCVLPPPGDSLDVRVIVGTAEGPVLLADRHGCRDLVIPQGPYMVVAVSGSGSLLAALSCEGTFKVIGIHQNFQELETAFIESNKKPQQMVWVGDDCIALYLAIKAPSNNMQHILFIGGPGNEWIPYQFDAPLHLVSEIDGLRVLGTHKIEFIQRVPASTEEIYGIGNCDPSAMLCYALERFEKGDVCAQESLKDIKEELPNAVTTCIQAASYEHSEKVESLMNASVFGRHFLLEQPEPKLFVETCTKLRICLELRRECEIPLTVPQLTSCGIPGIVIRLAHRRHHFLASRICEWVGHPREDVLFHWAKEIIRNKKGKTDEQLCQSILDKFNSCPGIGYAEVACEAAAAFRPTLAKLLLEKEPRGHAQVQVLLQLSQEGQLDQKPEMLRLAADKAVQSCDPDLLHAVITCACGGDPSSRDASTTDIKNLLSEHPQDLQMVNNIFAAMLQSSQTTEPDPLERLQQFYQQLKQPRRVATVALIRSFRVRRAEERMNSLRFAQDFFCHNDPSASEFEALSMQFCGQSCKEEVDLLKAQVDLELEADKKGWPNGPHRFCSLSVVDTVTKLLQLGEIPEADNLRKRFNISDKRYWRIKIRALSDAKNLSALHDLWKTRSSPIGYELFVDAFLKHGRHDLAGDKELLGKIKDLEALASFYSRLGREEEAQAARAQAARSGGSIFQTFGLRFGQG